MPINAATAYRRDMLARHDAFGADDGRWIAVATVIQHAVLVDGEMQAGLVRDAIGLATDVLGQAAVEAAVAADETDRDRTTTEALIVLADRVHDAGALNLAAAMFDGLLEADASLAVVQRGRIIAKRARVAWKLGMIDEAEDRYREVLRLGRRARSAELEARANIGFAALAQMRGNYPGVRTHSERAVRLAAAAGLPMLGRLAHFGLMIAAAKNERFDEALGHGWAAFQASGIDPVAQAEVLLNVGQVLLDSGHWIAARAAFADVVARELPARLILPGLGGLAVASASSDAEDWTEWACREVETLQESAGLRYARASALWECATALDRIGQRERSAVFRAGASRLASAHGFHEILYRIEHDAMRNEARPPAKVLADRAARVAQDIIDMAPEELPDHVRLTAAARQS